MKSFLALFLFIGLASIANASCSLSVLVFGSTTNNEMAAKVTSALKAELKSINKSNQVFGINDPSEASGSDYMYMIRPIGSSFKVTVANVGIGSIFYKNVYNSSAFASQNQVAKTLANDFRSEILTEMSDCK